MPHPYRPGAESYGRTHTLAEAAELGQIIVVRCAMCRRLVRFLASELVALLQPRRDALVPP